MNLDPELMFSTRFHDRLTSRSVNNTARNARYAPFERAAIA
jgi:hypothetical protein